MYSNYSIAFQNSGILILLLKFNSYCYSHRAGQVLAWTLAPGRIGPSGPTGYIRAADCETGIAVL